MESSVQRNTPQSYPFLVGNMDGRCCYLCPVDSGLQLVSRVAYWTEKWETVNPPQ